MKNWTPDLIIALIIVVSCIGLIAFGIDGEVKGILSIAAGWVFKSGFQQLRGHKSGGN